MRLARKRYASMFTADNEQIPAFAGPVVSDVDDPLLHRARRSSSSNDPNLAAYAVTADARARRLRGARGRPSPFT